MKYRLLTIIIIIIFLSIPAISDGFTHNPVRFEVIEKAGTAVSYSINLNSNKEFTENVKISFKTKKVISDNIYLLPLTSNWFTIPSSDVILPPNSGVSIKAFVKVPNLKGETMVEISLASIIPNSFFSLSKTIPFYLMIEGTELMQLQVNKFDILLKEANIYAEVELQNSGNIHIRPRIDVSYIDTEDKEQTVRVSDDLPVYPSSKRVFSNSFANGNIRKGKQDIKVAIKYYDLNSKLVEKNYLFRKII